MVLLFQSQLANAQCEDKDFFDKTWHLSAKSFSMTQVVLTSMNFGYMYVETPRSPRQFHSDDPLTPNTVRVKFERRFGHTPNITPSDEIHFELEFIRPEETFSGRHNGQYHVDEIDDVFVELRAGPYTKQLESGTSRFVSVDDYYDHERTLELVWWIRQDEREQILKYADTIEISVRLKSDPSVYFEHTFNLPDRTRALAWLDKKVSDQRVKSLAGDC